MLIKESQLDPARTPSSRPASVSITWVNWLALAIMLLSMSLARTLQIKDWVDLLWIAVASLALSIFLLERVLLGISYLDDRQDDSFQAGKTNRIVLKLVGISAGWAILFAVYWTFPYFQQHSHWVYEFFGKYLILIAVVTIPYVWYVDGRSAAPEDEYYHLGRFVLFLGDYDQTAVYQALRASLVKVFFFQYILSISSGYVVDFANYDASRVLTASSFGFVDYFIDTVWFIDVIFACSGYLLTLKIFGSNIRSTEATILGWASCLACYGIFYDTLHNGFVQFEDSYYWGHWLADYPFIKALWAVPIFVCLGIYAATSVQFGLRFSNLTHRGIITNGPFSLTKHPHYISKNISWWLISVPFVVTSDASTAVRQCLMLGLFNYIYYLRAKTEERHLMKDPVYQQYAAWIAEHGLISKIRRLLLRTIGNSSPSVPPPAVKSTDDSSAQSNLGSNRN